ncbi:uncharacterized protein GLRG_01158 [Colletotrichum graminicola M1.001]|uniref:Uncharacterized protein n=1 Tax=Colletotrichum graminicola (strain M1.001 / M2 / FGSC 10212) TaxID=645133 RepID=E3Q4J9_COLGM|nr:uncharacterized protein GLRG_01158 [Colletotrichum graminicola M1.001]EFQ26014.1 hypothetical protein GLRG_01158 [Colletotrichum graminicola M1.001]
MAVPFSAKYSTESITFGQQTCPPGPICSGAPDPVNDPMSWRDVLRARTDIHAAAFPAEEDAALVAAVAPGSVSTGTDIC